MIQKCQKCKEKKEYDKNFFFMSHIKRGLKVCKDCYTIPSGRKIDFITCGVCSKKFSIGRYKINKYNQRKTCSDLCRKLYYTFLQYMPEKRIRKFYFIWVKTKYCEICFKLFFNTRDKCIDHCHQSGKIRGIICNNCNRGLGYFNDSAKKMLNASKYITRSSK